MSQITNNLPDEFIRRAGGEVAFVVNFSGGKDSMRMLARVRQRQLFQQSHHPNWHYSDFPKTDKGRLSMNCNTVQIAGTSGLAYLESATRFLEHGDFVSARFLVEEGIRLAGNISGLDVGGKLQDLYAFICLKERLGKNDAISILGRHYYAGTDADGELPAAHSSTPLIVH